MDNSRFKFRAWESSDGGDTYSMKNMDDQSLLEFFTYTNDENLMQFTGLTDKNGVDIYDGDILDWNNNYLEVKWGSVGWILKSPMFSRFGVSKSIAQCSEVNTFGYLHTSEIIGNIHENKELLAQGG